MASYQAHRTGRTVNG